MHYITAAEAARRIGVSEKTVRLWVGQGKIATGPSLAKNRLAIPENEVERIARERALYGPSVAGRPASAPAVDIEALAQEIEAQYQRIEQLEARIKELEEREPITHKSALASRIETPIEKHTAIARKPVRSAAESLPEGVILASEFALQHGVNPRTFRDHIKRGVHGDRVIAGGRPKPGREHTGEMEYYLSPEQQEEARAFWARHNVEFAAPGASPVEE